MPSKRTTRAADAQPSQPASDVDAAQPTQRAVQASQAEAGTATPATDSQAGGVLEAGQEVSPQFAEIQPAGRVVVPPRLVPQSAFTGEPWPSDGTRTEQMGPNDAVAAYQEKHLLDGYQPAKEPGVLTEMFPLPASARMTMEQAYGAPASVAALSWTCPVCGGLRGGRLPTRTGGCGGSPMSCPEKHQKAGACVRDDAHKWHRASDGTKWEGAQYEPPKVTPKEDSSGAAVAKPEGSVWDGLVSESTRVVGAPLDPPQTITVANGIDYRVKPEEPIVGGQQVSDIPPEVAEVLAKQQAAQVETPQVDQAVAPAGTVRAVYTGSSASKLAPSIEAEMKRRLAKGPVLDEVPKARPQDPPRQLCLTCGVTLVGFDASHSCDKGDILKLLKPKGLHEALPPKLRFSGRYRLCLWRDAEGDYHVAEELVDENGAIVAFNVLDGPESWAFMGSRVLDLVVDKFTP